MGVCGDSFLSESAQQLIILGGHDTRWPMSSLATAGRARACDAALVMRIAVRGRFRIDSRCVCESRRGAAGRGEFTSGVDVRRYESSESGSCAESANDCELS